MYQVDDGSGFLVYPRHLNIMPYRELRFMIRQRFVSFIVKYFEEVGTKYPGNETSNIKMQGVAFSNFPSDITSLS